MALLVRCLGSLPRVTLHVLTLQPNARTIVMVAESERFYRRLNGGQVPGHRQPLTPEAGSAWSTNRRLYFRCRATKDERRNGKRENDVANNIVLYYVLCLYNVLHTKKNYIEIHYVYKGRNVNCVCACMVCKMLQMCARERRIQAIFVCHSRARPIRHLCVGGVESYIHRHRYAGVGRAGRGCAGATGTRGKRTHKIHTKWLCL